MPRPPRAGHLTAGAAIVAGLAIAGCGTPLLSPVGTAAAPATPAPGAQPSSRGAGPTRPLAPLTGLPVARAADAARPAVALDIAGGDPRGLGSADVVFEEIASPVRYIAVYQSREASGIGPIAATQPTDRAVLDVLHPLLGYDGSAAAYFIRLLDKTKIIDAGFDHHPALYATTAGGLTTSTRAITRAAAGGAAPPPLFYYRNTGVVGGTLASSGQSRHTSVRLTIPGAGTQDWTFDKRTDRWALRRGGPAVQAANLVVQMVRYKQINISPRRGVVVPAAVVTGSGRTEVFSGSAGGGTGGTVAAGTWSKPHLDELTNYFDSGGGLMAFQPGPTWVILAPPGTRITAAGA
jgi:hypothetical protein